MTPSQESKVENGELKDERRVQKKRKRSWILGILTLFIIFIGIIWFLLWFFYLSYHESTDDAYAQGYVVNVNAAVSGTVIAFFVDDTDFVQEGQLLLLLDNTHSQIVYERELATLAAVALQVKKLYDEVHIYRTNRESKRALLEKARFDYENREQLISAHAVSNEEFIHSKDDFAIAELALRQAEYQLEEALSAIGNFPIEKHPLLEQQKENVRTAYYNLYHCALYAPVSGNVARRSVEVGEWITPMTNLMAIIPSETFWVEANFKETQLSSMRIGQPATLFFDLYGSKVIFQGKVIGISSGTGSVFSLIPPQNATGNWIKIVQRLPVKIGLDAEALKKYPLRVGLSATVDVDVTDQTLPFLATEPSPSHAPIVATRSFDLSFTEVEKTIDKIIQSSLH